VAVYERVFRRYHGALTDPRRRFLVVTRYALRDAFSSRLFTALYALSILPSVIALLIIYLRHNLPLLQQLGLTEEFMATLTLSFFQALFSWQAIPAFFIVLISSPNLIAPDLANDALPLYLARPLSRTQYVAGKVAALFVLLSPITWIAGLTVFALQGSLQGEGWWLENVRIGIAYLVGHLTWIVVLSLLSLAISAWVRYKPAARGALFGIFFVLAAFAQTINFVTGTAAGDALHLTRAVVSIVRHLFGAPSPSGLPVAVNWLTLVASGALSVWLLNRKLRAHEVVR
jgi:ABC-2 type transport system permease protein